MKYSNIKATGLMFIMAAVVVACSSGGSGGVAGIGGSGFVASGSVTGFGSVFVNGIKFETDSSTFDIDGSSGTQADLAIGMQVSVNGSINSDGISGTATSISFDDQLQGPVASLSLPDPDGVTRTFSILGTSVLVNSVDTVFDVSGSNPALTGVTFDFDVIDNNNNVEVSGFFDVAGVLHATRVELKDVVFDASSIVELRGPIVGLAGTNFTVNGVNVDALSAAIDDLPNGLEEDALVEVKGTYVSGTNTITATRVEGEDNELDDANKVSIEGIITDFVNSGEFKVNNVPVDASGVGVILIPSTMTLRDGLRVEVEGPVVSGVLLANSVELRAGENKVHAEVTSLNPLTGSFGVTPFAGSGEIAITVTTATERENPVAIGNFVRVKGFEETGGGITATQVEVRSSPDDVIVQGNATAVTGSAGAGGTITVLGVTFDFDSTVGGTTDFENESDVNMTPTEIDALIAAIKIAPRLVKVKDNELGTGGNAPGIADEVDLE